MKYLQDSEGNTLEVPNDVFLFKGIFSFIDFAIKGEYSTDFELPNDSETRKAIGFYSINESTRITKKSFGFYVNGTKVSDGRLFVRSVGDNFDLFYLGGNTNWINDIQGSIKDLDFTEFDTEYTAVNVNALFSATDGLVFPVCDWAYNYKKMSNVFVISPISGVGQDTYYDLYPCFYVHTILKKILTSYGLKFTGNLKDDKVFNSVAITPDKLQSSAYSSPISVYSQERMNYDNDIFPDPVIQQNVLFKLLFATGTGAFDDANDRIVMPSNYNISTFTYSITQVFTGTLYLYKNGSAVDSVVYSSGGKVTGVYQDSGVSGDYYEVYVLITSPDRFYTKGSLVVDIDGQGSEAGTVYISNILPEINQFDFIKYVAQRFNCLLDYDPKTKSVSFTKLDSIKKEDATDLSEDIIEVQQVPASGFANKNYVRSNESAELVGYRSDDLNFGDYVISSDGEGAINVLFTFFRPSETFTNFKLEWLLTSIPLIRLEDSGQGLLFSSVASSGGNAVFTLSSPSLAPIDYTGYVLRVESSSYNGFFIVSAHNTGTGEITTTVPYEANEAGTVFFQKIIFDSAGSRELIIAQVDVNDINTGSHIYDNINIKIKDDDGTYPVSAIAWGYYAKPNIGTDLDSFKLGLNYGPVQNTDNISFGDVYHKNFKKVIQAPNGKATVLLTQTQYANLSLSNYIYIKTKDVQGYFLIRNIDDYTDQFTPLTMDLTLIK